MTLLVCVLAAVICTALWYKNAPQSKLLLGIPCWLFWGAALMWFIDACFEYAELGAEYFTPDGAELLNDLFLGLSVVALGLVIWIAVLLLKDPKGLVRAQLLRRKESKETA